jgi:hypothetical protein
VAWGSAERSKGKYKAEVLGVARINAVQVSSGEDKCSPGNVHPVQ